LAIWTSIGFKLTEDKMAETTTRDELLYQMIAEGMQNAETGAEQKIVLDALQELPDGEAKELLITQFYQDYDGLTEANKDLLDTSAAYLSERTPTVDNEGIQLGSVMKSIAGGYGQNKARKAQEALSADRSAVTDFTGRAMIDARNAANPPIDSALVDSRQGAMPLGQGKPMTPPPADMSQVLNSVPQNDPAMTPPPQQMPPTPEEMGTDMQGAVMRMPKQQPPMTDIGPPPSGPLPTSSGYEGDMQGQLPAQEPLSGYEGDMQGQLQAPDGMPVTASMKADLTKAMEEEEKRRMQAKLAASYGGGL
jgi:hypothetical protein